jgi:NADP-dependent 3-hydroxy acid dehydrogenase YdfG
MGKTMVVVGFGPGISKAVAEKFGASGFSVALVARNEERLAAGVKELAGKGIAAGAFRADATDPASIRSAVQRARKSLGPIAVIHWNAYGAGGAGDLLAADAAASRSTFDVPIVGLVAAVQEALPDLKESKEGALLVTNGAFGDLDPSVDAYAVQAKYMDLALANGAKHKLVGLLSQRLKGEGVYVGEIVINGTVKGSAWDSGGGGVDPRDIAAKFWDLYRSRSEVSARIPS